MSVLLEERMYFIFIQGKKRIENVLDGDNKSPASLVGPMILLTVVDSGGAQFEIYPLEGNALSTVMPCRQTAAAGASGGGTEQGRSDSQRATPRIRSVIWVVPGRCVEGCVAKANADKWRVTWSTRPLTTCGWWNLWVCPQRRVGQEGNSLQTSCHHQLSDPTCSVSLGNDQWELGVQLITEINIGNALKICVCKGNHHLPLKAANVVERS